MSYFLYTPNTEPKTSVLVAEFQQIRQVILIISRHTHEVIDGLSSEQLCHYFTNTILQTTDICGVRP